jgi:hypothetical protein
MLTLTRPLLAAAVLAFSGHTRAHHTYAMYDGSRELTVSGTIAKVEWRNPHIFIWVYVPNPKVEGGHDLYAFENGSIPVLERLGWKKDSLRAGDKLTINYWPLRDGRHGGHFHKATRPNGEVIEGAAGPPTRAPAGARP